MVWCGFAGQKDWDERERRHVAKCVAHALRDGLLVTQKEKGLELACTLATPPPVRSPLALLPIDLCLQAKCSPKRWLLSCRTAPDPVYVCCHLFTRSMTRSSHRFDGCSALLNGWMDGWMDGQVPVTEHQVFVALSELGFVLSQIGMQLNSLAQPLRSLITLFALPFRPCGRRGRYQRPGIPCPSLFLFYGCTHRVSTVCFVCAVLCRRRMHCCNSSLTRANGSGLYRFASVSLCLLCGV